MSPGRPTPARCWSHERRADEDWPPPLGLSFGWAAARRDFRTRRRAARPDLWLAIFFILPLLIVFKISLSAFALGRPPYLPMFEWAADESLSITLHFSNFLFLLRDTLYVNAYINSLRIAAISTIISLIIAFPMSWYIARSEIPQPVADAGYPALLTPFLLRVYA